MGFDVQLLSSYWNRKMCTMLGKMLSHFYREGNQRLITGNYASGGIFAFISEILTYILPTSRWSQWPVICQWAVDRSCSVRETLRAERSSGTRPPAHQSLCSGELLGTQLWANTKLRRKISTGQKNNIDSNGKSLNKRLCSDQHCIVCHSSSFITRMLSKIEHKGKITFKLLA